MKKNALSKNLLTLLLILVWATLSGCGGSQIPNTTESLTPSSTSEQPAPTQAETQEPEKATQTPSEPEPKGELTVAAAASLTPAFTEMGEAFGKRNNCTVTFSFNATGTLTEQIINGAPFDVFAAANKKAINDLSDKGFILPETNEVFTVGRVAIAALQTSSFEAKTLEDLLNPEIKKIAIANPESAPYGLAAKQALEKAGLWTELEPKLVYGKNISEALTFVSTGNAEAGFIALSSKDEAPVNISLIDATMHDPLSQSMGIVTDTPNLELAKKFTAFIMSQEGQDIMSQYGFSTPGA